MNNSHFKKFQSGNNSLGKSLRKAQKQLIPTDRRAPAPVAKPKPKPNNNQQSLF
jgi:hypothetical protein